MTIRLSVRLPPLFPIEALTGLAIAVDSMGAQMAAVAGNIKGAIEDLTEQSKKSSEESTKVAKESANLSRHLNRLTWGIILAAGLSALAAADQAGVAVWLVIRQRG